MFYSHEILTERKHGMATVWLVATLGYKAHGKRINKKALLGVNIPRACDTVTEPAVPMALRLQSNLLAIAKMYQRTEQENRIGILRVYASQCGFVLSDVEATEQHMRSLLQVMHSSQLDPNAGQVRDDPSFVPDEIPELNFDLSTWELETESLHERTNLPALNVSSCTSQTTLPEVGFNLTLPNIPTSRDIEEDDAEQPLLAGEDILNFDNDQALIMDAGFHIDDDGNLRDDMDVSIPQDLSIPDFSDFGVTEQTVRTHPPSTQEQPAQLEMEVDSGDIFFYGEDSMTQEIVQRDSKIRQVPSEEMEAEEEISGMEAERQVTSRRRRGPKILPVDAQLEIRSAELQRWQRDYLENMRQAKQKMEKKRSPGMTRRYAYRCVWGSGLGGLGNSGSIMQIHGPFREFQGDSLRSLIVGSLSIRGKKRSSDSADSEDGRRVRRRANDIEQLLSDQIPVTLPDEEYEIEVGREAQTPLDDVSSQMPWNLASSAAGGSRAGSARLGSMIRSGSSGLPYIPFSAGGPPSALSSVGPLDRRLSRRRRASESPLQGRGHLSSVRLSSDDDQMGVPSLPPPDDSALEDFELISFGGGAGTQDTTGSQWAQDSLRTEDANFLLFVETGLENVDAATITFEQLLPPTDTTRAVATQAFLHILNLANSGLLVVRQGDGLDASIHLAIAEDMNA